LKRKYKSEQAELAEKKQKYEKFKSYYKKPEQCDPPLTSQMRVQCANEYMRAREKFDELYRRESFRLVTYWFFRFNTDVTQNNTCPRKTRKLH